MNTSRNRRHEKNLSAQRSQAQAHSRLPLSHGHQKRSPADQPPSRQRPQAPRGLIPAAREPLAVTGFVGNYVFRKEHRLLNAGDYKRVFDNVAHKASHRHLLLLAAPNALGHHRLGLIIAKKHVRLKPLFFSEMESIIMAPFLMLRPRLRHHEQN